MRAACFGLFEAIPLASYKPERERKTCALSSKCKMVEKRAQLGRGEGAKRNRKEGARERAFGLGPPRFALVERKKKKLSLLAPSPPLSLLRLSAASSSATTPELTIPSRSTTKKTTTPSLKNRSPGATPRMRRAASQLPRRTPSTLPRRPCLPLPRPSGSPRRARSPRRRWRSTPSP